MQTTASTCDSGRYKKSTVNDRPLAPSSSSSLASASIPQRTTSETASSVSNANSLVDPANIMTEPGSRLLRKRPSPQSEPEKPIKKQASTTTELGDGKQTTTSSKKKSALPNSLSHLCPEDRKPKANFIPVRDYYHPGSFQKFTRACFEKDTDSADECDDDQCREKVQIFNIHDFIDSNLDEKNWMILWNVYIQAVQKKTGVIRRKHVPRVCSEFVQEKAKTIQERGLQDMLMLHLSNLVDSGLISADHLHICMVKYHDVISKS